MPNPYDNAANEAMSETLKELEGDIKELRTKNLAEMFPVEADHKAVEEMISKIEKSTDKNEMIASFKDFASKVSKEGLKAFEDSFQIAKKLVL